MSGQILHLLHHSKYILAFLLCIVEGPIVMVSSGFLLQLGQFSFVPLYLALVGGDFVADIGWYMVGRHGAGYVLQKFGKRFHITPELLEKIEQRFKRHQNKILLISKLTMGFGFALVTLLVAGILRVSLKQYAFLNLLGGFVWTAFLVGVGYFFGNIYTHLAGQLKILFLFECAILVGIGLSVANRYLRKIEVL